MDGLGLFGMPLIKSNFVDDAEYREVTITLSREQQKKRWGWRLWKYRDEVTETRKVHAPKVYMFGNQIVCSHKTAGVLMGSNVT